MVSDEQLKGPQPLKYYVSTISTPLHIQAALTLSRSSMKSIEFK